MKPRPHLAELSFYVEFLRLRSLIAIPVMPVATSKIVVGSGTGEVCIVPVKGTGPWPGVMARLLIFTANCPVSNENPCSGVAFENVI